MYEYIFRVRQDTKLTAVFNHPVWECQLLTLILCFDTMVYSNKNILTGIVSNGFFVFWLGLCSIDCYFWDVYS